MESILPPCFLCASVVKILKCEEVTKMSGNKGISRREFIKSMTAGVLIGAHAFGSKSYSQEDSAIEKVRVALVTGDNRRENLRRALELVKEDVAAKIKGKVMLKPNLTHVRRQLASTHVDAIRGTLDFVKEFSPTSIIVAEGAGGDTFEAYRNFDYLSLEKEYSVSLVDLNRDKDLTPIKALLTSEEEADMRVFNSAIEQDCRISVAIPKTHETAMTTSCLKNMMGCLLQRDRGKMHGYGRGAPHDFSRSVKVIHKNLIRIAKVVAPHVSVIDGLVGMEGNGPIGGDEVPLHVAIASTDFIAADAVAAKIMGFEPLEEVGYIYYGNELGLGVGDMKKIQVLGADMESVSRKFKPNPNYDTERLWRM